MTKCDLTLRLAALPLVIFCLTGCGKPDSNGAKTAVQAPAPSDAAFKDIAADAGLAFVHHSGVNGQYLMPEIMGSGVALFDYDNDGDLDVYLVNSGTLNGPSPAAANQLFQQTSQGKFIDVTAQAGLADNGYGMGTAVGDIDNDGDLDLLVTNYGPDRLYRNNGNGSFTDISVLAGINANQWSTSAAFCDLDADGLLDLVIATYVSDEPPKSCTGAAGAIEYCGPKAYRGLPDRVFRNQGEGRFEDVGEQSGLSAVAGKGLGVICFDFNDDHLPDILVANDGERNHLWINGADGRFEESGVAYGVALNIFGKPEASMGIAFGDADGDLGLDVLLTHLDQETNTLLMDSGSASLLDATAASGLGVPSMPFTGFGTAFFDAENDGDLDLVIANGRVRRAQGQDRAPSTTPDVLKELQAAYAETNSYFENTGGGSFTDSCNKAGQLCSQIDIGRGLITGDVDNDGDLDVLISNSNGHARLYRNDLLNKGNWLQLNVVDPVLKRAAIGALARVRIGTEWQVRPVLHTSSYLSSGAATVHFGLGEADVADEVLIVWPDGAQESFPGVAANQLLTLERGRGSAMTAEDRP